MPTPQFLVTVTDALGRMYLATTSNLRQLLTNIGCADCCGGICSTIRRFDRCPIPPALLPCVNQPASVWMCDPPPCPSGVKYLNACYTPSDVTKPKASLLPSELILDEKVDGWVCGDGCVDGCSTCECASPCELNHITEQIDCRGLPQPAEYYCCCSEQRTVRVRWIYRTTFDLTNDLGGGGIDEHGVSESSGSAVVVFPGGGLPPTVSGFPLIHSILSRDGSVIDDTTTPPGAVGTDEDRYETLFRLFLGLNFNCGTLTSTNNDSYIWGSRQCESNNVPPSITNVTEMSISAECARFAFANAYSNYVTDLQSTARSTFAASISIDITYPCGPQSSGPVRGGVPTPSPIGTQGCSGCADNLKGSARI